MNNGPFTLTAQQTTEYHGQGFVVLPPITDESELDSLRAIFDRLFSKPADGSKPLYYDLAGNDPNADLGSGAIPQLLHPSHHVPELKQTRAWQASLDIAEQLLDMGSYSRDDLIIRDHAIVKPPGSTGATPWHQDEAYWEDDMCFQELSIWIALQETTRQMGCLQFIPGSHKNEVHPHHPWKHDPDIIALEIDTDHLDDSKAVSCPLPPGGATVHNARTMHYATGNQASEPRRAFILTIGTPPTKLEKPRDFYWNRKDRSYKEQIVEPIGGS